MIKHLNLRYGNKHANVSTSLRVNIPTLTDKSLYAIKKQVWL